MKIVDWALKPVDSYWKKRFKAEQRLRRYAEANATCAAGFRDQAEEELGEKADRLAMQAMSIQAYEKKIAQLNGERDEALRSLEEKRREVSLMEETIRALKEARSADKTNARLWKTAKSAAHRDGTGYYSGGELVEREGMS